MGCKEHPEADTYPGAFNDCTTCAIRDEEAFYAAHDSHAIDMLMYGSDDIYDLANINEDADNPQA